VHTLTSSFVLGYHGCDRSVAEDLLKGKPFLPSKNDHDWLGSGIYFWETNPQRGLDWAKYLKGRSHKINIPEVVGAVIDLGYCLDMLSANGIAAVRAAHDNFIETSKKSKSQIPSNSLGPDLLLRKLDCSVINFLHESLQQAKQPLFDSVRGVFIEGDRIYTNSGFYKRTHIQLCIRNPKAIKGVFRVDRSELS
jgi:hypothetical protein